nr:beta-lactamase family protein [Pedobacter sp.]
DIAQKVKNTPTTKFRLASLSKTITVIAIMQLVQDGKLNVTDRISDVLDWYPTPTGNCVSIQDLMMMNSGIPSFTNNYDFLAYTSRANEPSVQEFIMRYCSGPLQFQPGSAHFDYSNSNYYILGAIIEKVTGKPYAEVIEENIFKRLGMTNSGYYYNTSIYDNIATGYSLSPVTQIAMYYDQTSAYATGGLYSTVEDLFKLDQALYGEKLLKQQYVNEIFKNRYPDDKTGESWLYGWQVVPGTKSTMVYKTGLLWGVRTLFLRDLANKNAIILLTNTDNNNGTSLNMIVNLLNLMKGNAPPLTVQQDIGPLMVKVIQEKGVDEAIKNYKTIKAGKEASGWVISDSELFNVGQYLISKNNQAGADKIFALLSADFPESVYATYRKNK